MTDPVRIGDLTRNDTYVRTNDAGYPFFYRITDMPEVNDDTVIFSVIRTHRAWGTMEETDEKGWSIQEKTMRVRLPTDTQVYRSVPAACLTVLAKATPRPQQRREW
jgi:hypothetical protein